MVFSCRPSERDIVYGIRIEDNGIIGLRWVKKKPGADGRAEACE